MIHLRQAMAATFIAATGTLPATADAENVLPYIVPVDTQSSQGEAVPDVLFADGSGMPIHLSRYVGFVVVLNFWSQDCGPCLTQMPYLDRLQGHFRGQKLLVIPVSEDSAGPAAAKVFFARNHYMFLRPFADPGAQMAHTLGVSSLPTTFIIDREGRAVSRVEGSRVWDSDDTISRLNWLLQRP